MPRGATPACVIQIRRKVTSIYQITQAPGRRNAVNVGHVAGWLQERRYGLPYLDRRG